MRQNFPLLLNYIIIVFINENEFDDIDLTMKELLVKTK
jgi:hypothetical protein